jgi:hypothetical protein
MCEFHLMPFFSTAEEIICLFISRKLSGKNNEKPPVVALFHELAHNYDYTHGTLRDGVYDGKDIKDKKNSTESDVNNRERVAVGLPIDHDNKPKTAERLDPLHPTDLTENAFRNEVGVPKRTNYRNK